MPIGNPPVCPKCGLSDRTEMAKMSMTAPVPKEVSHRGYNSPWGRFFGLELLLFVVVCIISFRIHFLLTAFGLVLTLIAFLVLSVPLVIWARRTAASRKAEVARYNAAIDRENDAAFQVYKEALYHYNNDLYICRRDGTAFIHDS